MLGNVWEWTGDWYGEYPDGKVTDSGGPSTGSYRVYRGGSWANYASNVRSATRYVHSPDIHPNIIGFRLVRTK